MLRRLIEATAKQIQIIVDMVRPSARRCFDGVCVRESIVQAPGAELEDAPIGCRYDVADVLGRIELPLLNLRYPESNEFLVLFRFKKTSFVIVRKDVFGHCSRPVSASQCRNWSRRMIPTGVVVACKSSSLNKTQYSGERLAKALPWY